MRTETTERPEQELPKFALLIRDAVHGDLARGAPFVERVDLLVKLISHQLGVPSAEIDRTVETGDQKLNEKIVQGGSGAQ